MPINSRRVPTFQELEKEYQSLLDTIELTRPDQIRATTAKLLGFADRYKEVEKLTGVPWYFVAVIHYRESNCDFNTHLHNGDSLARRTVRVPRGYPKTHSGPFTWIESAVDALKLKGLHLNTDWSWPRICYELERYNGFGYRQYHPSTLSPYLWAGTSHYTSGKYVSDGKWSSTTEDVQLGTIPLIVNLGAKEQITSTKEIIQSSRKLTLIKRIRNAIVGTFTTVFTMDNLNIATDYLGKMKQFALDHSVYVAGGTVAAIWIILKVVEAYSVQDYNEGRYTPSKEEKE